MSEQKLNKQLFDNSLKVQTNAQKNPKLTIFAALLPIARYLLPN